MGVPSVLTLVKLQDGRLIVTSEHGFITIISPERQIVERFRPPIFPEEMALDKNERFLVLGSLAGYTVSVLDLETMQLSKKRIASISSCGVALDSEHNRIFLSRLVLGDLLVLDSNSLDSITRIDLDPGLRPVCYLPTRNIVVVGNYLDGNLYFIDGVRYTIIRKLWAGSKIRSIKYSGIYDRLYVQTATRILEIDLALFLGVERSR
jgi:hypothetical protein